MAHVVLTGGAGFVGSHLCDALVARGDTVVAVDNLLTGRRRNVAHLMDHDRFAFLEQDVSDGIDLGGIGLDGVLDGTVDAVLHFASPASPVEYLKNPLATLRVGSAGTHHAIELAHDHGARFLLASTSEVYGDPLEHPQPETYWGNVSSTGPRSVYDEAKRYAEAVTMSYHREFGTDVRVVRIFNTYGPRMAVEDGRVVSNFIVQALRGTPITIYGDGSQTRSFCYVDDEVRGILALLDGDTVGPVNIGNDCEFTMLELADLVLELTGSASPVVHEPAPEDDPTRRCPDLTFAHESLGWSPTIALRDGVARTIPYFRDELQL